MKELIIELTKEEEMQIFGGRVVYEIININGKDILIVKNIPEELYATKWELQILKKQRRKL